MRIAYLFVAGALDRTVGVTRKVTEQINHWRRRGHEVRLFIQTHTTGGPSSRMLDTAGIPVERFIDRPIRSPASWGAAWLRLRTIRRMAAAIDHWRPTLTYSRFTMSYPALVRLARRIPLVLEVNTDDLAEYRRLFPGYKYWYHRLTRDRLLRAAAGAVYMTPELSERRHFRALSRRFIVIANGIDLDHYPPLASQPKHHPRLIFVGEPGLRWHGIDKVVQLARLCPDWEVDVVGYGPGDLEMDVPANVTLHGYLPQRSYEDVMQAADVGLGTLALHRKNMSQACTLKVREYLAYGVPAIIGYQDVDFPDGAWFLLGLPNTPDNVSAHVSAIREFVAAVRGRRVSRDEVRHLDAAAKEEQRLAFFDDLISGPGAAGSP